MMRPATGGNRELPTFAMFPQHKAIAKLLLDDDPTTVELTKQQLLSGGANNVPDLVDLMTSSSGKLAKIIHELVTEIEVTDARQQFTKTCGSISSLNGLEEICWLLAKVFLPGINLVRYRGLLDQWADEMRHRSEEFSSEAEQLGFLTDFFGNHLGFRGNSDDYYSIRNSLLPCVIDSRRGIPTSLALIYLFVGRRAGIEITGVDLPGHFLIRYQGQLFDPYEGGRVLRYQDCLKALRDKRDESIAAISAVVSPKVILAHILSNLLYILEHEEHQEYRGMVSNWLSLVKDS
jgi:regulator of sirC expression with transglutaminase-like and TPR domain